MSAKRRHVISTRTRRTVWIVGSVVVVAIAISVAAAFNVSRPAAPTKSALQDGTVTAQASYESALAALASGETTKALDLLRTAAAAGSVPAQTKLAELTKAGPSSTSATQAPSPGGGYVGPVADMATLLPATVTGYTTSPVERSGIGAILSLTPTYQGPYGKVTIVVMSVLDKGSEAGAKSYVDQLPLAYSANGEAVSIGGNAGRFGTDGARLAAVAFARGRYAFEVVATASRPDPTKIRDIALAAAATFPAAR